MLHLIPCLFCFLVLDDTLIPMSKKRQGNVHNHYGSSLMVISRTFRGLSAMCTTSPPVVPEAYKALEDFNTVPLY